MKLLKSQTNVKYKGKIYIRYEYEDNSTVWTDFRGNIVNYTIHYITEKEMEKLYQSLIPIQTPNSDANQRFDLKNSIDEFLNNHFGIPNGDQQIVLSQFRHWFKNQANGETPVEDNTVGQVSILFTQEEINKLKQILDTKYSKDWEFKMNMILKLSTNKPVETTKEQPNYLEKIFTELKRMNDFKINLYDDSENEY